MATQRSAPEISDTYTAGAVLTPTMVPGNMLLSVDYFNIDVQGFVGVIGASVSMAQCLTTGNPTFCSLITRAASSGSLWIGTELPGRIVTATNTNTGSLATEGIDINGNWAVDLGEFGMDGAGRSEYRLRRHLPAGL